MLSDEEFARLFAERYRSGARDFPTTRQIGHWARAFDVPLPVLQAVFHAAVRRDPSARDALAEDFFHSPVLDTELPRAVWPLMLQARWPAALCILTVAWQYEAGSRVFGQVFSGTAARNPMEFHATLEVTGPGGPYHVIAHNRGAFQVGDVSWLVSPALPPDFPQLSWRLVPAAPRFAPRHHDPTVVTVDQPVPFATTSPQVPESQGGSPS